MLIVEVKPMSKLEDLKGMLLYMVVISKYSININCNFSISSKL
jgi:hypothetical protein